MIVVKRKKKKKTKKSRSGPPSLFFFLPFTTSRIGIFMSRAAAFDLGAELSIHGQWKNRSTPSFLSPPQ
jgi:hypothetical protein